MARQADFTDQKPHVATEEDVRAPWGGATNGRRFRCNLCGHRFQVGDTYRWVYSRTYTNFMVCESCDGPDVHEKWAAAHEEAKQRFWWLYDRG